MRGGGKIRKMGGCSRTKGGGGVMKWGGRRGRGGSGGEGRRETGR